MKKQIILLALMLLVAASAFAVEQAEIGGLWYELVSDTKEAKVIKYMNDVKYSGDIAIPETVEYEGADHSVTNIGCTTFLSIFSKTFVPLQPD